VEAEIRYAARWALKGLTQLSELNLSHTKVTTQGVDKLQQALPNCKIDR
jgi:hypothetical protein